MSFGKYIIVDNYQPILFHKTISHDSFLRVFPKNMITSAGFFQVTGKPTEKDSTAIEVSVFGKKVAAIATHPVEYTQNLFVEVFVAAAEVLDHGAVVSSHVLFQVGGILGQLPIVQFAAYHVEGQIPGVIAVVIAVSLGHGRYRNHSRPKVGMGQGDVPGGIATDRMS